MPFMARTGAKNENADALPESKDKYFGKYIWGMNMLRDRLSGDNRKLRQLEKEQLTLVSTIAHGISTRYCYLSFSGAYYHLNVLSIKRSDEKIPEDYIPVLSLGR